MEENEFNKDYCIDVDVAVENFNLSRPAAKALVRKNKAKLNELIITKLANQNSYQSMSLLYGIINLDSAEKVYGCKTQSGEVKDGNHTIKIEVSSDSDKNKLNEI